MGPFKHQEKENMMLRLNTNKKYINTTTHMYMISKLNHFFFLNHILN